MDQYIERLLQEQGVPKDLEPEIRAQLVAELNNKIADFMNRRLIDSMDDATLTDFQKILDADEPDAQAVQDFIATRVPNRNEIATQALLEFRDIYLGSKRS